jgi:hypothetical protein
VPHFLTISKYYITLDYSNTGGKKSSAYALFSLFIIMMEEAQWKGRNEMEKAQD